MRVGEALGFIMIMFAVTSVIGITIIKDELRRTLKRKDTAICLICCLVFSSLIGFGLMLCWK